MTLRWTNRTVAWVAAGFTLTAAASLTAVFLIGLPGCSNQESAAQPPSNKPSALLTARAGQDQRARVKVVRPAREHLKRLSTPQPAHVEPYENTNLYAKVSGYLSVLGPALDPYGKPILDKDGKPRPLDIGDRVAKDQVLAELSIPEMKQERVQKAALVDQARAGLGQAEASAAAARAMVEAAEAKLEETNSQIARYEAELAYRKVQHERYQTLVKEHTGIPELADEKLNQYYAAQAALKAAKAALVTDRATIRVEQARLTKAEADVASAKAHLKVAEANLEHTNILLGYATIKAPYEGIITRRLVDTGAFVQSATTGKPEPLFTLARVDRLRIVANLPEAEAGRVKIGQPATLQMDAARGQQWAGQVVRFADSLDPATRTMRTEVELDMPARALRPGWFGSLTILLADFPDALLLPTSALLTGGSKPALWVVEEGKARRREVELGINDGVRVQVTRGLTGNEQVIADGKVQVREAQAVEIAP